MVSASVLRTPQRSSGLKMRTSSMCGQLTIGPRLAALESANKIATETIESVNEVDMSHMTARVGPNPMSPFAFSFRYGFLPPVQQKKHTLYGYKK